MTLHDYLALPYIMDVTSVARPDGEWVCRVAYDEIPGCVAEGSTPYEALDRLEMLRSATIVQKLESGQSVPLPVRMKRSEG